MLKVSQSDVYRDIFTLESLRFLESLFVLFSDEIKHAVDDREKRTADLRSRKIKLGFDKKTARIRSGDWVVTASPGEILDRRVEITGPVSRKMIINGLNSGARIFMADFEDSNSPTWKNCMQGQINLRDAVNKSINYFDERTGKKYALNDEIAVLFVRPRGLHLQEKNITFRGESVPAALVDFGLYFFHNVRELVSRGSRPYFYLPKLEHYHEAELWDKVFSYSEDYFDVPRGTIRATVLIETLPAVFQMNEILYALKDHSAGLNCGRWDYIFSFIKTLGHDSRYVLPDRMQVGMTQHFLRSYSRLLIQTCHDRGTHAIGGMAAQIPIKNDELANNTALEKVRRDKLREVLDGHDGTWVAHPGLVEIAYNIFNKHMPAANQIDKQLYLNKEIGEDDLLTVPTGTCSEKMLRNNIRIGYQYLRAWLNGMGCVPINNLMEDAATAEISRAQIWQWKNHGVTLDTGEIVTIELINKIIDEEILENDLAKSLFTSLCVQKEMDTFLTLKAYEEIV